VPVCDNRLQWDSAEGPQPVDLVPDISKDIFKLDTLVNTHGFAIVGEGVWSSTENDFTRNKTDFNGFMASVAKRFGETRRWNFRWRGRSYQIDNSTELLVPIQRPGIGGPQSPGTYSDYYPAWPEAQLRLPSANRDVIESKADITYRLANTFLVGTPWKGLEDLCRNQVRRHQQPLPDRQRQVLDADLAGVRR